MNITDAKKFFNDHSDDISDFVREGWPQVKVIDGYDFELVTSERKNSDQIVIIKFDDKFYRVNGNYNSWEGTDFYDIPNSLYEVKPVEITITQYDPV